MNNPEHSGNEGTEFFGAISRNCKTVIVKGSKSEVKREIGHLQITKNNIAIFKCWLAGENTIEKRPIHTPRFKLHQGHHIAITEAGLNFLSQGAIS